MKKSILIGVLCALMLFTFAACESQVPNMLPDEVSYIEVAQSEPAVVGKAFDASIFSIIVHSTNPNVGDVTVPGTGYVEPTESATTFTAGMQVEATYAGKTSSPRTVETVTVVDATITGLPESVVVNKSVDKADLTVVAILSNGETMELADDDYDLSFTGNSVASDVAVTLYINLDNDSSVKTITNRYTIDVVAAPTEPDATITGINVLYSVSRNDSPVADLQNVDSLANADLYLGDVVTISVVATKSDDTTTPLTYGTGTSASTVGDLYQAKNVQDITFGATTTVTVDDKVHSATVVYYNDELSANPATDTVTVKAGVDTLTGTVTVSQSDTLPTANTVIDNSNIENIVEVDGLSKLSEDDVTAADYVITVDSALGPYTAPESGSVNVYFFLSYESYGETISNRYMLSVTTRS